MCHPHSHPFRHFHFSLQEKRILGFKAPPPQESPEKYREQLQSLFDAFPFTPDQLREYERRMKVGESSSLLQILSEQALGTPEAERCRALAESLHARKEMVNEVQRIDQEVLEKMVREQNGGRASLETQKPAPEKAPSFPEPKEKEVEAPRAPAPSTEVQPPKKTEAAPSTPALPPKKETSVKDQVLETVGWNKLSPETKELATSALWTVGILGGAYATYRIIKRLFGGAAQKTKAAVEKAGAVVHRGWLDIKITLLIAAGAVAGYWGWKEWQTVKATMLSLDPRTWSMAEVKKHVEDLIEKGKKHLPGSGHGEGAPYEISDETYKELKNDYLEQGRNAQAKIATRLGVSKEAPVVLHILDDLDKMQEGKARVPGSDILYLPVNEALKKYEGQIGHVFIEVLRWVEEHEFELILAGLALAKIGILKDLLKGSLYIAEKATKVVKEIATWGIKEITSHPLISLLTFTGAFFAIRKVNVNVLMPENLHELYRACAEGHPLAINAKGEKENEPTLQNLQETIRNWVMEENTIVPWIKRQLNSLVVLLLDKSIEFAKLSPEGRIAKNNKRGFKVLREELLDRLEATHYDTNVRNSDLAIKVLVAMELLEEFETAYIRARCTDSDEEDTSSALLEKLTSALGEQEIGITIETSNDIVKWKGKDMEKPKDLCVDPGVTDRKIIEDRSAQMMPRDTGTNLFGRNFADEVRRLEYEAQKKGERLPWVGDCKILAIPLGNVWYILDLTEQVPKQWEVSSQIVGDLVHWDRWGLGGEVNDAQVIAHVSNGIVDTAVFSLGASFAATLVKFAIGGGERRIRYDSLGAKSLDKVKWVLERVTPGYSQVYWARRALGIGKDAIAIADVGWAGKHMTAACAKAGIDVRWVSIVQTTQDPEKLNEIARGMHVSENIDTEALRTTLKEKMSLRLDTTKVRGFKKTVGEIIHGRLSSAWEGKSEGGEKVFKAFKYTFADLEELKSQGTTVAAMLNEDISLRRLLKVWTVEELLRADVFVGELVRVGVRAEELLRAGKNAQELLSVGIPQEVVDQAVRTLRETAAREHPTFMQSIDRVRQMLRIADGSEAHQALMKAAARCTELGVTSAEEAEKLLQIPGVIRILNNGESAVLAKKLAEVVRSGRLEEAAAEGLSAILRTVHGGAALEKMTVGDILNAAESVTQWQKAGLWTRGLYVAGAVVEAGAYLYDCYTLEEGIKNAEKTLERIKGRLPDAGFTYNPKTDRYVHKASKIEVSLEKVEKQLSAQTNTLWTRAVVDGAGLATTLIASSFCLGPGGLVVAGVLGTVHAAATAIDQSKQRNFVRGTETAVLAIFGTSGTIGKDEYQFIEEASSTMISDIFRSNNEEEKRLIRKKMFAVLFLHELTSALPEHRSEILGEGDAMTFLAEDGPFMRENGDFDRIVKPYLACRLFELSNDDGTKWADFRDLKTWQGWFDMQNVRPEQVHEALREAAVMYTQHLRELRYRELSQQQGQKDPEKGDCRTIAELEMRQQRTQDFEQRGRELQRLSEKEIFGRKVSAAAALEGPTKVELYFSPTVQADRPSLYQRLEERSNMAVTRRAYLAGSRDNTKWKTEQIDPTRKQMRKKTGGGLFVLGLRPGDLEKRGVSGQPSLEQFAHGMLEAEENSSWREFYRTLRRQHPLDSPDPATITERIVARYLVEAGLMKAKPKEATWKQLILSVQKKWERENEVQKIIERSFAFSTSDRTSSDAEHEMLFMSGCQKSVKNLLQRLRDAIREDQEADERTQRSMIYA